MTVSQIGTRTFTGRVQKCDFCGDSIDGEWWHLGRRRIWIADDYLIGGRESPRPRKSAIRGQLVFCQPDHADFYLRRQWSLSWARRKQRRQATAGAKFCPCGAELTGRTDAKTCSARCRQRLHRTAKNVTLRDEIKTRLEKPTASEDQA